MLPNTETLKSLIAASTPGPWQIANHGTWEVEAPPNQLIADCGTVDCARGDAKLIALAPALAAEVIRLRELVNPTTPDGKLAQWKAAEELRKNRPKAATAWEPTERKGWWMRRDVHGVGIAFAGDCGDFFADTSGRESSGEPSLDTAKKAADEALKAAGWELVE